MEMSYTASRVPELDIVIDEQTTLKWRFDFNAMAIIWAGRKARRREGADGKAPDAFIEQLDIAYDLLYAGIHAQHPEITREWLTQTILMEPDLVRRLFGGYGEFMPVPENPTTPDPT